MAATVEFQAAVAYIERQVAANELAQGEQQEIPRTCFHGLRAPEISVRDFVIRIAESSGCSPCCLLIALDYLDVLQAHYPIFALTPHSLHRLVITATMVACKFFDERFHCNAHWAYVGGVGAKEMNRLELEFLFLIQFDLSRTPENYSEIVKRMAGAAQMHDPTLSSSSSTLQVTDKDVTAECDIDKLSSSSTQEGLKRSTRSSTSSGSLQSDSPERLCPRDDLRGNEEIQDAAQEGGAAFIDQVLSGLALLEVRA